MASSFWVDKAKGSMEYVNSMPIRWKHMVWLGKANKCLEEFYPLRPHKWTLANVKENVLNVKVQYSEWKIMNIMQT